MLGKTVEGAVVVDLFAGSGAIGLEAISRGAASCTFVEMDKLSAGTLQANIDMLACGDRARLIKGDALGLSILARCPQPCDLIFLDPPYPLIETPIGWQRLTTHLVALSKLLSDKGFIILRTPYPHLLTEPVGAEAGAAKHGAAAGPDGKPGKGGKFAGGKGKKGKPARLGDWRDVDPRAARDPNADPRSLRGKPVRKGSATPIDAVESSEDDPDGQWFMGGDADAIAEAMTAHDAAAAGTNSTPSEIITRATHEIPGVRGPETHRFGSMSVHFYMKA